MARPGASETSPESVETKQDCLAKTLLMSFFFFFHRKIRHYVSLKWPLYDNNKVTCVPSFPHSL